MIQTESGGIEFAHDTERFVLMLEVKMMLNRFPGEDLPKLKALYWRLRDIGDDIARRRRIEDILSRERRRAC